MTSTDALEAQAARQRDALAGTIDALSAKLDVKARAHDQVDKMKDSATTDTGKPQPKLLAAVAAGLLLVGLLVWRRRRS